MKVSNENQKLILELKRAQEIETKIIRELREHLNETKDYPLMREQIIKQIKLSEVNAQKLEEWIEIISQEFSPVRKAIESVVEAAKDISATIATDKEVKSDLANYVIDQLESATYEGLITAKQELQGSTPYVERMPNPFEHTQNVMIEDNDTIYY